jgi:hypothetical protein
MVCGAGLSWSDCSGDRQQFLSLLCLYLGDADLESFLARIASEPLRLQTSIFFSRLLAFKVRHHLFT